MWSSKSSTKLSSRPAFLRDERGVTAIEYALIAGVIVAMLVVALPSMSGSLSTTFSAISGAFP